MKKLITLVLLTGLLSCSKQKQSNARVVKNCTGNYLTIKGNDYLICNESIVADYVSGDEVYVHYEKTNGNDCDFNEAMCLMVHDYKGIIIIKSVN